MAWNGSAWAWYGVARLPCLIREKRSSSAAATTTPSRTRQADESWNAALIPRMCIEASTVVEVQRPAGPRSAARRVPSHSSAPGRAGIGQTPEQRRRRAARGIGSRPMALGRRAGIIGGMDLPVDQRRDPHARPPRAAAAVPRRTARAGVPRRPLRGRRRRGWRPGRGRAASSRDLRARHPGDAACATSPSSRAAPARPGTPACGRPAAT